jgi:hypothetical protein
MNDFTFLFRQDGWVIALVLFAGCLGAAELGYWLSKREIDSDKKLKKEHLSAVQTAVAALLGLLLAFSVSMAVSRFEARKVAVVDEANAIGTAYLRAALLPESQHAELNEAFKRYTDVRLELARPDWYLAVSSGALEEQSALQRQLFTAGVAAAELDQRAVTTGLYIQAVNEMIDSAGRRDAGLRNHVPETVVYVIFAACLATLGIMGYASRLSGGRSLAAVVIISAVLAAVVFIIADFDRPYRGVITVSQQPIEAVRQSMEEGLPVP